MYGYAIARIVTCPVCGVEEPEPLDSGWGFFGLDDCLGEAAAAIEARSPRAA